MGRQVGIKSDRNRFSQTGRNSIRQAGKKIIGQVGSDLDRQVGTQSSRQVRMKPDGQVGTESNILMNTYFATVVKLQVFNKSIFSYHN